MSADQYWVGKVAVVDWALTDIDGTPQDGASVTGTITRPTGATTPMTVTAVGGGTGRYRAAYEVAEAGLHAWRLVASGVVDDAEEGTFIVRVELGGAPPITRDPTQPVGQVRLLISDVNEVDPVFADVEISGFLTIEGGNVRLAAAQALDTMACNEVMVSKVIRTQDLQTDGSKVSAELRARAESLRAQAADRDPDGNAFALDIVDFDPWNGWWRL